MDCRNDDGETASRQANPTGALTPTGDAVERWLRHAPGELGGERDDDVPAYVAAVEAYLYPPAVPFGAAGSAVECRLRAGGGEAMDPSARSLDPLPAALLAGELGPGGAATTARPSAFLALTCCHEYYARPNRYHRACGHAHVDVLVRREPGEASREIYSVRVVNVDLPRSRHAEAFAESATLWPDHAAAVAAGVALARERWGAAVAVVHLTPRPADPRGLRP